MSRDLLDVCVCGHYRADHTPACEGCSCKEFREASTLDRVQAGELCARCGGLGEVRPAGNAPDETEVCPDCGGTGRPPASLARELLAQAQARLKEICGADYYSDEREMKVRMLIQDCASHALTILEELEKLMGAQDD